MVVGVDDVVSDCKSIARDRSGVNRDTDALVFLRSHSSQTTGDIEVVTKEKQIAEKPSDLMANVAGESAHPVPLQVHRSGARSHASVDLGSVLEDETWLQIVPTSRNYRQRKRTFLLVVQGLKSCTKVRC